MSGTGRDRTGRDRDDIGRARNARARDELGRPLGRKGDVEPDAAALPPAEALDRAQKLLDDGHPFTAHEVLEATWKAAPEAERELWRGLAQLAVGITHVMRDNPTGGASLLARSAASLEAYATTTPYDVDVDGLRDWASRAAADLTLARVAPRLRVA